MQFTHIIQLIHSQLNEFIETLELEQRKNVRDGGPGFNLNKAINPAAFMRFTKRKIDHTSQEDWQKKFDLILAFAKYVRLELRYLESHEKNEAYRKHIAQLFSSLSDQALRLKDQETPYYQIIKNLQRAIINHFDIGLLSSSTLNQAQNDLRIIWQLYLNTKVPDELVNQGDYSFANFLTYLEADTKVDQAQLDAVFERINLDQDYSPIGIGENEVYQVATPIQPIITPEEFTISKDGVALSAEVQQSDIRLGMQLSSERFGKWRIKGKVDNKIIGYQNKPLADGWYQFVIPNLLKSIDNVKQDDCQLESLDDKKSSRITEFRYFPCSPQSGGYIPYKKYVSHSEIAGGLPVFAAGGFKIVNGKIVLIDNSSGHYNTNQNNMRYAYAYLQELGVIEEADAIEIKICPELSAIQKVKKIHKKASATAYGIMSYSNIGNADVARAAEERPYAPTYLRGDHLYYSTFIPAQKFLYSQICDQGNSLTTLPTLAEVIDEKIKSLEKDNDNLYSFFSEKTRNNRVAKINALKQLKEDYRTSLAALANEDVIETRNDNHFGTEHLLALSMSMHE